MNKDNITPEIIDVFQASQELAMQGFIRLFSPRKMDR